MWPWVSRSSSLLQNPHVCSSLSLGLISGSFQTSFLCPSYQGDSPVIFQHKTQPVAFIFLKPPLLFIYMSSLLHSQRHMLSEGKCRVHWSLSTHNSTMLALSSCSIFSEQQKKKIYAVFKLSASSLKEKKRRKKKPWNIYIALLSYLLCVQAEFRGQSEEINPLLAM